jgi:hypothetical protein
MFCVLLTYKFWTKDGRDVAVSSRRTEMHSEFGDSATDRMQQACRGIYLYRVSH